MNFKEYLVLYVLVFLFLNKKEVFTFQHQRVFIGCSICKKTTATSKLTNIIRAVVANNSPSSVDFSSETGGLPLRRKDHKNKYATFSKKESDPLLKLMELQRKNADIGATKVKTPIRGTTVPTQPRIQSKAVTTTTDKKAITKSKLIRNNHTSIDGKKQNAPDISTTTSSTNTTTTPQRTLFTPAKVRLVQPSDPYTFGYIEIGRVLKSHGVRGEVKFYATADTIDELGLGSHSVVYVKKPSRRTPRPIQLAALRKQVGNQYLVTFEGVDTRDLAEGFRDYVVYIKHESRPQLVEDEYMIRDLVGLLCYKLKKGAKAISTSTHSLQGNITSKGSMIVSSDYRNEVAVGMVEGVVPPDELCSPEMAKLMHSILEIKFYHNEELCLIPLVPSIVRHVDIVNRILVIDPPEGLLDLTYCENRKYVLRGYLPACCESVTDEMRRQLASATVFVSSLPPLIPVTSI